VAGDVGQDGERRSRACLTIGHSTHGFAILAALVTYYRASVVVDVRSIPYSKWAPQFDRESVQTSLEHANLKYVYMGDCLGARYSNPDLLLVNGRVNLGAVAHLPRFQSAIDSLVDMVDAGNGIVLMCSEGDPFNCHRFVLVAHALQGKGITVGHILADGRLVSSKVLEDQLLKTYFPDLLDGNLFERSRPRNELVEDAYARHAVDIAYRPGSPEEETT
jgi:uncharacterized protein (DUF488 family)